MKLVTFAFLCLFTFAANSKEIQFASKGMTLIAKPDLTEFKVTWPDSRWNHVTIRDAHGVLKIENGTAEFIWNQNSKKSASAFLLLREVFLKEAYADECTNSPQLKMRNFSNQISPLLTKDFMLSCGQKTAEKLVESFGDELTDIVSAAKTLVQNPQKLFTDLTQGFENLARNLPEIAQDLSEITELLKTASVNVSKPVVCDIFSEAASIALVGSLSGPRAALQWPTRVAQFAARIKSRKQFLKFFQANKEAQKFLYMYSGSLRQVDFGKALQAGNFTNSERLAKHFEKHGAEFGVKSEQEYLDRARKFAASKSDSTMISTVDNERRAFKWNVETSEFLVVNKEGQILSYYRSDSPVRGVETIFKYGAELK